MPMTFEEAYAKLEEIAGGEFFSIEYKLTNHGNGVIDTACNVYIFGGHWHSGNTWEVALQSLTDREPLSPETIAAQMPRP